MENLSIYESTRRVPDTALKQITAGRLKGKSDINPMWRIKTLTEQFGPCGIGWYYEIVSQWLERGGNDDVAGFCNINLYVKINGEWSKPIAGTGGSSFITKESKGLYTSDEVFKMALTDAISVACKALGFGADVYWSQDRTKYSNPTEQPKHEVTQLTEQEVSSMVLDIRSCDTIEQLSAKWNLYRKYDDLCGKQITTAVRARRAQLGI